MLNTTLIGDASRRLLLVGLMAATMVFTAYHEDYLDIITVPFWGVLCGGYALMVWLALRASIARLLSLMVAIFTIEYVKEALGIRYGLWIYHGAPGGFVFGVWSWVLGGLACYTVAIKIVAPILRKLPHPPAGWINPVVLVVLAAVGLFLLRGRFHELGLLYWIFYAVLLVFAAVCSRVLEIPLFVGLVVASWITSNASEFVGSVLSGIWTFPHHATYPPAFLLFVCWPIEIVAQFSLAYLLLPADSFEEINFLKGAS
jgi:hypothetical protein